MTHTLKILLKRGKSKDILKRLKESLNEKTNIYLKTKVYASGRRRKLFHVEICKCKQWNNLKMVAIMDKIETSSAKQQLQEVPIKSNSMYLNRHIHVIMQKLRKASIELNGLKVLLVLWEVVKTVIYFRFNTLKSCSNLYGTWVIKVIKDE